MVHAAIAAVTTRGRARGQPSREKYLGSLAGPLPDLIFRPAGGIDAQTAGPYLALPNVACAPGSWMVAPGLLAAQDFGKVEQLARDACALGRRH